MFAKMGKTRFIVCAALVLVVCAAVIVAAIGHILNLPFPYACGLFHLEFTGITVIRLNRTPGRQTLPCLELANDGRHIRNAKYHRLEEM